MTNQKTEEYFIFSLLALVFALTFFIFKPFLYAIILAVVFATVFSKINKKLLRLTKQNRGLSALISSLVVIVVVVTPIIFLSTQMFREATVLYSYIASNGGLDRLSYFITNEINSLEKFFSIPVNYSVDVEQYFKGGLNWVIQNLGLLFSNALSVLGGSLIFVISLYYLFKDGTKIKNSLLSLSPLKSIYNDKIFSKLELAVNSVVKGSLLVAVVQGIFVTLGFAIFGIPNAVFWGSVTLLVALIPGIGTSLIVIPAIIFLYFKGNIYNTIGFAVWGFTAVSLIDNVLKPKLIEQGMLIHPFLILLSAVGGIMFFGPLGFLLGPLILGLLFVLLEIYSSIQKEI